MSDLLLHPVTERALTQVADDPPHAILLIGQPGIGKASAAKLLAVNALNLDLQSFDSNAYTRHVYPEDGKSIGIDQIRELERFLSLKVPSVANINRAIVIEAADTMTDEAQNALLKTLEEPPEGTILILTANHEQSLLPTISSRVQTITVRRPQKQALVSHFETEFTDADLEQVYAMSSGLPGLMRSLLEDDDHPLKTAAETARQLLRQDTFERLLEVDRLAKDKPLAANTVYILQQMAHLSLQQAEGTVARKWQRVLKASLAADTALRQNGQPKLVLTNLMLQL